MTVIPFQGSQKPQYKGIHGRCYCGAIEWEVVGKVNFTAICHCTDCQTLSGSAFGHTALMIYDDKGVVFTKGKPKIFHAHSDAGHTTQRGFCDTCGTPLFSHVSEGQKDQHWAMRTGCIIGDPHLSPEMDKEIFMKSKPNWVPTVQSPGNRYHGMPDA